MGLVTNTGCLIYYETIGSGPPLVLIHGIHGSSEDWKEYGFVKHLKKFQLVLIDLRGHGKSSKIHEPIAYDPRIQAKDIITVLDDLEIQNAIIWGFSYGARMAIAVSLYFPTYVSKLIIGGMHGYPVTNLHSRIIYRQNLLKSGLDNYLDVMKLELSNDSRKRFLKNDQIALIQMDESILEWNGFGEDLDLLYNVKFPILLYLGSEDRAYLDGVTRFLGTYTNIEYVSLEGMRHYDTMTKAKVIIEAIKHFLE